MTLVVGFDLDLTLVDSADGIVATFQATARENGLEVDSEAIRELIGISLQDTVAALMPGVDVDAAVDRYRALYPELGVPPTKLLPGAQDAVAAVHKLGGRVVVVSAKFEPAVRRALDHVGLEVDDVVGDLYGEAKGAALLERNASAHVGDHPGDMIGARTAGATAVGVTTGSHDALALREAGADVVFADLLDFPFWLNDAYAT
jgi:phosphoglycolate phosphatase